ncbi:CHAT domain-containing protein [Lentzea sp. HUAS TT2]|uniref:CHAT domain-containing protein n=1 Tax=Lentzea sp. HUAS TT2 TaxID=3447454 RepID=UPI003F715A1E
MPDRQAPSVTVRFVPILGGVELEFSSPHTTARPTFNLSDTSRITLTRKILRDGLRDLKSLVVKHFDGARVCNEGLPEIAALMGTTGRLMISTLCSQNPRLLNQLQDFWRRATRWDTPGHPIPVVEYVGQPEHVIPIEHMPFFDLSRCGRSTTDPDMFVEQCRAFVGFSCVVRRKLLLDSPIPQRDELRPSAQGRLQMRFLRHSKLKGADAEYSWLTSDGRDRVDVLGPFPAEGENAADIAAQIFDPRWLPDGARRSEPEQIQHFSCHCDTNTKDPLDYELQLRGEGADVRLRVGDLKDHFTRLAGDGRTDMAMPLIVLNACGTSAADPESATSFPRIFLENENRAVIGTEVAMPDRMAAAFSKKFYELLLLKGEPLGIAAHEARAHLLTEFRNPLGLAYSVYGNTELRIVNGVV